MSTRPLSIAEILDQPALMRLWPAVGCALGLAESTTYQLAAENRLPVEVVQLGRTKYVRTVDLWDFLRLRPEGHDNAAGWTPAAPVEQSAPTAK